MSVREPLVDTRHPGPGRWWWLSFADPARPKGAQFQGVAIVRGEDLRAAIKEAWRLKINPGGEVMGTPLVQLVPAAEWRERLLTREETEVCDAAAEQASWDA